MQALILSGLYDASESIEICVVADSPSGLGVGLPKVVHRVVGVPRNYERPTLLRLRENATKDTEEVFYWYLHTKGLRWFGTDREANVLDWIALLLYWNVTQWRTAVARLSEGYDTYGCNQTQEPANHYSGNFWWARSSHLRRLPATIGPGYNDPEFWILNLPDARSYCVYNSGLEGMGHYLQRYPKDKYIQRT